MASIDSDYKYICPLVDARRGYVFGALYDNKLHSIIKDQYIKLDELLKDVSSYNDVLFVSYEPLTINIKEPNINIEKIVNKHITDNSVNPHSINPIYLKKTEAEEKHDQRD